jgi:tetratricopeptide (TPR) repeat protein
MYTHKLEGGRSMRRPIVLFAGIYLGLAAVSLLAQGDEAGKANDLYVAGKKLDALPLYEELAKSNPKEWIYAERLADCLYAEMPHISDAAQVKAIRLRIRDEAKRAIALGDTHVFMESLANLDLDDKGVVAPTSPASALIQEGEKAYGAGDLATAMQKYQQAADMDPTVYEAPLFAGDTAFVQKDLKTAALWFAKAIAVNPNRETAYRYWGDAMMKLGGDPMAAKNKFVDAVVAEPYSKYAWQGLQQWAQGQKAMLIAPKIKLPSAPVTDPNKPNNITINIDPTATDDKKNPGSAAWLMYSIVRAGYRGDQFKKEFPNEKEYRHSLKEEDAALSLVVTSVETQIADKKIKRDKLDEGLRNLLDLHSAGMLDCWILINAADRGIAQDYTAYRKDHRELLHDYIERFVVHGGISGLS